MTDAEFLELQRVCRIRGVKPPADMDELLRDGERGLPSHSSPGPFATGAGYLVPEELAAPVLRLFEEARG